MFVAVLGAGEQLVCRTRIRLRIEATGRAARQNPSADAPIDNAHECFGGGSPQPVDGEDVAVGVIRRETNERRSLVAGSDDATGDRARDDDLAECLVEPRERGAHAVGKHRVDVRPFNDRPSADYSTNRLERGVSGIERDGCDLATALHNRDVRDDEGRLVLGVECSAPQGDEVSPDRRSDRFEHLAPPSRKFGETVGSARGEARVFAEADNFDSLGAEIQRASGGRVIENGTHAER